MYVSKVVSFQSVSLALIKSEEVKKHLYCTSVRCIYRCTWVGNTEHFGLRICNMKREVNYRGEQIMGDSALKTLSHSLFHFLNFSPHIILCGKGTGSRAIAQSLFACCLFGSVHHMSTWN